MKEIPTFTEIQQEQIIIELEKKIETLEQYIEYLQNKIKKQTK